MFKINKIKLNRILAGVVILTTSYFSLPTSRLHAAFLDPGYGTRPMGMGGAFTAVADDINASLYNPAGVMLPDTKLAGFMYAKLYTGLDDVDLGLQHAAFILPTEKLGSFGLTWTAFASASNYSQDTLMVTYAREIPTQGILPELYGGINIKYLSLAYGLDERTRIDPLFVANGSSKSNYSVDIGFWSSVLADSDGETSLGLVYKDVNQPDMGLGTQDLVPAELVIGAKRSIKQLGGIRNALLAMDVAYRNQPAVKISDQVDIRVGTEGWFFNKSFAARVGGDLSGLTGGFSIKRRYSNLVFQLDYALLWPLNIQSTTGSHRMSISCGF